MTVRVVDRIQCWWNGYHQWEGLSIILDNGEKKFRWLCRLCGKQESNWFEGLVCTSPRFGPRMYCFPGDDGVCLYCGLPIEPRAPQQKAAIEAARHETWWRTREG